MKEIPINWRLAGQILLRHNRLANLITTLVLLGAWLILWLVARWVDIDYYAWLREHIIVIAIGVALFHFIPVNLIAIRSIFKKPFRRFRLVLVEREEEKK